MSNTRFMLAITCMRFAGLSLFCSVHASNRGWQKLAVWCINLAGELDTRALMLRMGCTYDEALMLVVLRYMQVMQDVIKRTNTGKR